MSESQVVTAQIAPIEAKHLLTHNLVEQSVPAAPPTTLILPQFVTSPADEDGHLDFARVYCNEATHARAREVAEMVIRFQEQMPLNELSANLLTLAYGYLSLENYNR